jgi:hypothetical protein
MVKAVDGSELENVAGFGHSYGTTVWRIAIQGPVRSPGMVIVQIGRQESLEMPLVENNDVIEQFSA